MNRIESINHECLTSSTPRNIGEEYDRNVVYERRPT